MNLLELFHTWQAWNARNVVEQAARRADTDGRAGEAEDLRRGLHRDPAAPTAIEALAAQHQLVELLGGWRWHTVTAAREQGATWADIAAVTGTDPATAQQEFSEHLAQAEHAAAQSGITFHDAERYRGAVRDDTQNRSERDAPRALTGEETHALTDDRDDYRIEHISGPDSVEHGLATGEIALPGGLPPEDDDAEEDEFDVPRWDDAFDIADRDGYVMFDPAAPGGFRGLTPDERAELLDAVRAGPPASQPAAEPTAGYPAKSEQRVAGRSAEIAGFHDGHDQASDSPTTEPEAGRPRSGQTTGENADPPAVIDSSHSEGIDRLQQGLDNLRVQLTGYTWREGVDRDQALADRREQLDRWYDDDTSAEQNNSSDDAPADGLDPYCLPQCIVHVDDPRDQP